MATTTTNYGMTKPAETEFYNVAVQNNNMDIIDAALAAKAPAGYGLGTYGKECNDCNNAIANGFYSLSGSTLKNGPSADTYLWYGSMFVVNRLGNMIEQVIFYDNRAAFRSCMDGVWGEWEHLNPPMVLGVEYRTTERWNGKPVYTVLTSCGAIGASVTNVDTIIPTSATVIRHADTIGNMPLPFTYGSTELRCEYNNGKSVKIVVMYGTSDFSSRAVMSQAWYVKA